MPGWRPNGVVLTDGGSWPEAKRRLTFRTLPVVAGGVLGCRPMSLPARLRALKIRFGGE